MEREKSNNNGDLREERREKGGSGGETANNRHSVRGNGFPHLIRDNDEMLHMREVRR